MTKKEALNELYAIRDDLIKSYVDYAPLIPRDIEQMHINKQIDRLTKVIESYYKK